MTKVQVPLLLVLGYLLVCLLYPKAWVGFDWRIDHLDIAGNRFKTVNSDGHVLWESDAFEAPLSVPFYFQNHRSNGWKSFCAVDVDSDGKDELFYAADIQQGTSMQARLCFYDHNGTLQWSQEVLVKTTYPGDRAALGYKENTTYAWHGILPISVKNHGLCVMTSCCASDPAREQMMLFSCEGVALAGPYLQTGSSVDWSGLTVDVDGNGQDEVIVFGLNNRNERAFLAVFDPMKLFGVSPSYDEPLFQASGLPRGSQLYYVSFPETRVSEGNEIRNSVRWLSVKPQSNNRYECSITEGNNLTIAGSTRHVSESGSPLLPEYFCYLDEDFIPQYVSIGDGRLDNLNSLLRSLGKAPYSDKDSLQDALLNDIIVYHGDSIVYHPVAGICYSEQTDRKK